MFKYTTRDRVGMKPIEYWSFMVYRKPIFVTQTIYFKSLRTTDN